MLRRKIAVAFLLYAVFVPGLTFAQTTAPAKIYTAPPEVIAKIKDEGMNRSQVMQTISYLTDVIGGRLTNSPSMKRANEWTRDQMTKWGLQNARLEPWGPFGRGWSMKSFSAQVVAPQAFPVIAYPKAWSPSTKGAVTADVVYLDAQSDADLEKYKGKLAGKIVLMNDVREVKANFEPMGVRYTEEELAKMANAPDPASAQRPAQQQNPEAMQRFVQQFITAAKRANFLMQEGAAVLVSNSGGGSGGTLFVQSASVAQEVPANATVQDIFGANSRRLQPYQKEAESRMLPQITMATEDYNRLVRMTKLGETVRMTVDLQAQYHDEDLMGYNTTAEIPGTDLKDEIVMLGGHMDSWHSSTGATDNAAGVAVAMEAVRILQTLGLKPRRTIRVGLWSGEEQGLHGSRAYVRDHFGAMVVAAPVTPQGTAGQTQSAPELLKKPEYDKFSAYYNLDNGTGKIRGVYMQGNSAVGPIFRAWLEPFAEMGAKTLTLANTGGTDHLAFDGIGLPGFQFIQDEVEYDSRTHHSNQDNFDRIQADDVRQAATIMAAFIYQTAMMDEKLPRKTMR